MVLVQVLVTRTGTLKPRNFATTGVKLWKSLSPPLRDLTDTDTYVMVTCQIQLF